MKHVAFVGHPLPYMWQCDCGSYGLGGIKGMRCHLFWARRRGDETFTTVAPVPLSPGPQIEEHW